MARAGVIAFPVILFLGGVTGYLTYTSMIAATPEEGIVEGPYWKALSTSPANQTDTGTSKPLDESKFSKVVTINILKASDIQGNPDYDPDAATASSDSLITWINTDAALHTATSGTGPGGESGKLFDSGFLNANDKFSIPAADVGSGEHAYYCQVHPYMTSKITVE